MPSLLFSSGFMQTNSSSNTAIGRMFNLGVYQSNLTSAIGSLLAGGGDGGAGQGRIYIMKGTVPTDLSTITLFSQRSSDVLVGFTAGLTQNQYGNLLPSGTTYYANPAVINTVYVSASATGTATWFWLTLRRQSDGSDTIYQQFAGTVGATGSGADLEIASTTINTGQQIRIVNLRFVLPTAYTY